MQAQIYNTKISRGLNSLHVLLGSIKKYGEIIQKPEYGSTSLQCKDIHLILGISIKHTVTASDLGLTKPASLGVLGLAMHSLLHALIRKTLKNTSNLNLRNLTKSVENSTELVCYPHVYMSFFLIKVQLYYMFHCDLSDLNCTVLLRITKQIYYYIIIILLYNINYWGEVLG